MADKLREGIDNMIEDTSNFGVPLHDYFKPYDDEFRRNMLGRLDNDLGYYTGYGHYYKGHLWNQPSEKYKMKGEPEETVELMKGLYDSLADKPKGMKQKILDYERELKEPIKYDRFKHGNLESFLPDEMSIKYQRERYPREEHRRMNELLDDLEKQLKNKRHSYRDDKGVVHYIS